MIISMAEEASYNRQQAGHIMEAAAVGVAWDGGRRKIVDHADTAWAAAVEKALSNKLDSPVTLWTCLETKYDLRKGTDLIIALRSYEDAWDIIDPYCNAPIENLPDDFFRVDLKCWLNFREEEVKRAHTAADSVIRFQVVVDKYGRFDSEQFSDEILPFLQTSEPMSQWQWERGGRNA